MTRYRVVVAASAARHLKAIRAWSLSKTGDEPGLLLAELETAFERLRTLPHSGSLYTQSSIVGVRRVRLRHSRYHVYYTVDDEAHQVLVRAVWYQRRGAGPTLG